VEFTSSFSDLPTKRAVSLVQAQGDMGILIYNQNLEWALRQLVEAGHVCSKSGGTDIFGNSLSEILHKYYMLEYEDLEVVRIKFPFVFDANSDEVGEKIFEFIFQQDCISKDLFLDP